MTWPMTWLGGSHVDFLGEGVTLPASWAERFSGGWVAEGSCPRSSWVLKVFSSLCVVTEKHGVAAMAAIQIT